jgi:hypothetical protein
VIRAGLRRLLVVVLVLLGGVAAISATLGALGGRGIPHAVATGYYVVGVMSLLMCLALGLRGPTRPELDDDDDREAFRPPPFGVFGFSRAGYSGGRRPRRQATPEERREARLGSLGLFGLGLLFIVLGAAIDPAQRLF